MFVILVFFSRFLYMFTKGFSLSPSVFIPCLLFQCTAHRCFLLEIHNENNKIPDDFVLVYDAGSYKWHRQHSLHFPCISLNILYTLLLFLFTTLLIKQRYWLFHNEIRIFWSEHEVRENCPMFVIIWILYEFQKHYYNVMILQFPKLCKKQGFLTVH